MTAHSYHAAHPRQGRARFGLRRSAQLAPALLLGVLLALGGCATKAPEPPALTADRVVGRINEWMDDGHH
jgi:hypothetical protein